MPRGDSSRLIFGDKLSHEEAVKIGRKGGLASVEARRKRKTLKEQLLMMMELDPTIQDKLIDSLLKRAYKTNDKAGASANKAFELIRETLGETPPPPQKQEEINIEDLTPLGTLLGVDNVQNTNN